jgi:hypothetical protein
LIRFRAINPAKTSDYLFLHRRVRHSDNKIIGTKVAEFMEETGKAAGVRPANHSRKLAFLHFGSRN